MLLNTIFKKPVDRAIEGVIKADDEKSLLQEVEEYVLTNEVAKRLEDFLDAYNNYEGANGAWISGFFGSGKSHLLKMLALLLENRSINGTPVQEMFLPKCAGNPILKADLKKAAAVPSKSILFNIDQKADVISKTQIDALLAVFVKVFDEMCGYYGKQGHIAQFERDLDGRGLYEPFKVAYKETAGLDWERGREQAILESKNISAAYATVSGDGDAAGGDVGDVGDVGILDNYRKEYKVSIEDFANNINEYIRAREKGFRLNFFVDEVGQYIADNVKLMTNLQTIAESLATKCGGRAWIIVTAQEDMDSVVGEMTKQQGNDFSKIQGRFANRMKLTSADVAEVIEKRLLMKNDNSIEMLSDVYHKEVNNLKTLFNFADGTQNYRNFRDREHFILAYPFIPYQFVLLQQGIRSLSEHNAFEGRHSSVGERSMLAVFQQVAKIIVKKDIGTLATFDLMFEGIRNSLKTQIQHAVGTAENQMTDKFVVRVLKALLLVKYVKEFKATVRNVSILMQDEFGLDQSQLRKKVAEALNLLEKDTYLQRNGDIYEYLTNEEKDVEQEIKNTEIETSAVTDELSNIIFREIIKDTKIKYKKNGQDYSYARRLDDRLVGRDYELSVHVVSPLHDHHARVDGLKAQAMVRNELLVWMPPDERLINDLHMHKKTEKYVRLNISSSQKSSLKKIVETKSRQNQERHNDIKERVAALLGRSKIFAGGDELDLGGEDPQTRIRNGFFELILRVYPNLAMLRDITYNEKDIPLCLERTMLEDPGEAGQEILAFIKANHRGGVRTSLKGMLDNFEKKPFGWDNWAIICTMAKLCASGKIEVRAGSDILENAALANTLANSKEYMKVHLVPQIEFNASELRALKDFYNDFFNKTPRAGEAKELGKETAAAFRALKDELNVLAGPPVIYPFQPLIKEAAQRIETFIDKPYTYYLTDLGRDKEELMDLKEELIDPVRRFMNKAAGNKAPLDLYEELLTYQQEQSSNFDYVKGDDPKRIAAILSDQRCFKGNRMKQAKTLMDGLKEKIATQLKVEKEKAAASLNELKTQIMAAEAYTALEPRQQRDLLVPFSQTINLIESHRVIAFISDMPRRFKEGQFRDILMEMDRYAAPPPPERPVENVAKKEIPVDDFIPKASAYISIRSIRPAYNKKLWLETEGDVDRYVASLKEAVMKEINNGKRIAITS
ncbi:MAG: BREX system P-loop protein BrxC [bacterium]|nr:BREX system P-loop protein BrxC [bacterium]